MEPFTLFFTVLTKIFREVFDIVEWIKYIFDIGFIVILLCIRIVWTLCSHARRHLWPTKHEKILWCECFIEK